MGDISVEVASTSAQVVEVEVAGAATEVVVDNATTVEVLEVAVPGPRGLKGEQGDRGPIYDGEDLPDFTLIFNNQLV